jgi:hypothetical protein
MLIIKYTLKSLLYILIQKYYKKFLLIRKNESE